MDNLPFVSILIPTSNRSDSLSRTLDSLSQQDYAGTFEVVVVDDGSTDGTRALVEGRIPAWGEDKLRYTFIPKGNISHAKNKGLEMARGEIVVSTDDDCTFDSDWLARLVSPFQDAGIGAVGGADKAPPEMAPLAGAVDYGFTGLLGSGGVRSGGKGVRVAGFFPRGCNMAVRKCVLGEVGNFDTLMYNGEEIDLDYRIAKAGYNLHFQENCTVVHHRRATLKGLVRQVFGRGVTRRMLFLKHPEFFEFGYCIPAVALLGLLLLILVSPFLLFARILLFSSLAAYLALLAAGGFHCLMTRRKPREALYVPLVLSIQHFVYGAGILFAALTKPYDALKKNLESAAGEKARTTPLRVVHSNDGYGPNQGDRAILRVMTADLHKAFPGIEIRGFLNSWVPGPRVLHRFWRDLKWADIFLLGGGQVLHDQTCLMFLFASLGKLVLARLARTPSVCYAVGAGPISSKVGRSITRIVLAGCALIIVRDEASKRLLEEIGVPSSRIKVTADPAFRLKPSLSERAAEILADLELPRDDRPTIAFCPRRWFHYSPSFFPTRWRRRWGELPGAGDFADLVGIYARLIDRLVEELNARVLLIPMKTSERKPDPGQDDDVVCAEIIAGISNGDGVRVLEGNFEPSELKSILGSVSCVVSMRMHAVIFAISQGVPSIGIGLSEKFSDLFNRMGMEQRLLDVNDVEEEKLFQLLQAAMLSSGEERNKLIRETDRIVEASQRSVEMLKEWWFRK